MNPFNLILCDLEFGLPNPCSIHSYTLRCGLVGDGGTQLLFVCVGSRHPDFRLTAPERNYDIWLKQ